MSSIVPSLIRVGTEAWSMNELAARSDIDAIALQRAQSGDLAGWDVGMVTRLSRVVGADPAATLSGSPLPMPRLLAFLREASHGIAPRDTVALRRALSRASALREAGLRPVHTYQPRRAPGRQAYAAGYAAARRVRRDIGNESAPLVELRPIIEGQLGVLIAAVELDSPGLEALAVADDSGAAIVLNLRVTRGAEIWRRSITHELCHLLFDPRGHQVVVDVLEVDEPQSEVPGAQRENREQRARAFAAELLIPLKALRTRFPSPVSGVAPARQRAVQVCGDFGAPWELSVRHLVNHQLIQELDGDRLLHERSVIESTLGVGHSAALEWARARVEDGDLSEGRVRDLFGADWPAGDQLSA